MAADTKGRTLVEALPHQGGEPGGFVKGATLLEPTARSGPPHPLAGIEPIAATKKEKLRTVFDPGLSATGSGASTAAAPQSRLVGWLVSFSHVKAGEDFRLREGRNLIGSDSECEVVLRHGSVSAKHAVIMYRDGKFQIRDNDSTNGTYVDGEDIFGRGAIMLEGGEQIRIGDSECVLYPIHPSVVRQ